MGWVGVVHRWLVGVFRPATTEGFTMFSNCCKLDPGPPLPRVGTGDTLEVGGIEAGDDTGVVMPKLEFGRGCGDMLRGMGDI